MNPEYVLDKMQYYEVEAYYRYIYKKSKESWEQTRFLGYISTQVNSTKKIKMSDIMEFPWDTEEKKKNCVVSDEEKMRMQKKLSMFEKKLQNNNGKCE